MKKITLNVESLSVESFETASVVAGRGTIQGHATAKAEDCGSFIDNCPSGMCASIQPWECISFDPAACESVQDPCIGTRGCA